MRAPEIVLASASPRRLELLRALGLRVTPRPSGLPEPADGGAPPEELVVRLAELKGRHVTGLLREEGRRALVLGADTEVVLDDTTLGKPRDPADAAAMLRRLAGRDHEVLTGVYLARTDDARETSAVSRTRVRFRDYDERTIKAYVRSGEPLDKAGAYGIQGRGVLLTERIEGSWSNVVGLPLELLPELFRHVGVDLLALLDGTPER